ncbi:SHOCT domain-containing protein [Actinokineospora guangxiensis]|uniref:SHOCT domain-containing protein n=1 Tax=Actinokineospora guangxiensis TaxID=1490288 RepID=A0ABW0EYU1_9PSEU
MFGWHSGGFGWEGVFFAITVVVLFWGGLATTVVLVFRHFGPGSAAGAKRILDERFARGEIDAEEYAARRAKLER